MKQIGQEPVIMHRETSGFILNRIQYAILNECMHLVNDDIASARDVDKVVKFGLGPRYAFMGPLETIHLNADGIMDYAERYSQKIEIVSNHMKKDVPDMKAIVADRIAEELEDDTPLDMIQERRLWRNKNLTRLRKLHSEIKDGHPH